MERRSISKICLPWVATGLLALSLQGCCPCRRTGACSAGISRPEAKALAEATALPSGVQEIAAAPSPDGR